MTNETERPDYASAPDSGGVTRVTPDTIAQLHAHDLKDAVPFGKYMLVGKLGSGGMGVVYLAVETFDENARFRRELAIKTIRHDSLNASTIELFRQEAGMMAQIKSDAVVQIHEIDTVRGYYKNSLIERPYIAMERILGITFRSLIDQLRKKRAMCPAILAAALIRAAADGLFDLHSLRDQNGNFRRAVHRDVTPRNLMLTPKGAVKVIDFGVADVGSWNRQRDSVEPYGINAAYLAPELFDESGYLSNKADIFSLGLVLHELLTGKSVFNSKSVVEQCAAIEAFSFTPLPSIPQQLNDCLRRMVEIDPDKRHPTAKAVADELQEIVTVHEPRFHNTQICADHLVKLGVDLNSPRAERLSTEDLAYIPLEQGSRHSPVEAVEIQVRRLRDGWYSVRHTVAKHDIEVGLIVLEHLRSSPATEFILIKDLPPLQIQLTHETAEIRIAGPEAKIYLNNDSTGMSRLNMTVKLGDNGTFYLGRRNKGLWPVDYHSATFPPGTSPRRIPLKEPHCFLAFQDALDVAIVLRMKPIAQAISLFAVGGRFNA